MICLLSSIFSFYFPAVGIETHHTKTLTWASKWKKDGLFSVLVNLVTSFLPKWYPYVEHTGGEQGPLRAAPSWLSASPNVCFGGFQKFWCFSELKFISIVVRVYKYSERHLQIDIVKCFHTHSLNTVKTPAAASLLGSIRTFFKTTPTVFSK